MSRSQPGHVGVPSGKGEARLPTNLSSPVASPSLWSPGDTGWKGLPLGTSLVVQWLRLCSASAGGVGLVPGRGTKIPHAM